MKGKIDGKRYRANRTLRCIILKNCRNSEFHRHL